MGGSWTAQRPVRRDNAEVAAQLRDGKWRETGGRRGERGKEAERGERVIFYSYYYGRRQSVKTIAGLGQAE